MTPCGRVRNDQLATLKQHGGRRRRPSGLWSICVSGDRCGDAVGFSLSTRRQCNGRRQAERAGVTPRIARTSTFPRVYRLCRNERLRRSGASFWWAQAKSSETRDVLRAIVKARIWIDDIVEGGAQVDIAPLGMTGGDQELVPLG